MKSKMSVVIPTLQKNREVLVRLLETLCADDSVCEIILIDNSLQGLDFSHEKFKIHIPEQNLYVNPSWNLGVSIAKGDVVGLLNDDIAIAEDFCSNIIDKIDSNTGILGICRKDVVIKDEIIQNPDSEKDTLHLEKANFRSDSFGIAMFFKKSAYCEIPDSIKIAYGDDWIFTRNQYAGRQNYVICGQAIYHLGSLTSSGKSFNPILKNDGKIYKRLTVKWYHRLLSFEERDNFYKLRLFGVTLKLPKLKKHF